MAPTGEHLSQRESARPDAAPSEAEDLRAALREADLVAAAEQTSPPGGMTVIRALAGDAGSSGFQLGRPPSLPGAAVYFLMLPLAPDENANLLVRPVPTLADLPAPPTGADRIEAVAFEFENILRAPLAGKAMIATACSARAALALPIDLDRLEDSALSDPARRAAWLAVALASGQAEALGHVDRLYTDSGTALPQVMACLVEQYVSAIRAPSALERLISLAGSRHPLLAAAAIHALRFQPGAAKIPALSNALDSRDSVTRYDAMMGLVESDPDVGWAPDFRHFTADEVRYRTLVEAWLRARRGTGSPASIRGADQ